MSSIDAFLEHPSLKYHWVQYIPTERIADDFWGRLQTQIVSALSSRRVFFSKGGACLKANQLRIVPSQYRDADGQPLIPDLVQEQSAYISEDYDSTLDIPVLRRMRTSTLSIQDFLDRIARDLDRQHPRMHTLPPQQAADWHTRVADRLISAIDVDSRNCAFLKRLPIVPLNNGRWVRSFNASIFLPTSGGIEIPTDLPLSLVDAKALEDVRRTTLFSYLGITTCAPAQVFPLIEQQYMSSARSIQKSLSHVKFMFWHHNELPPQGLRVWLASNDGSGWFKPSDAEQGWVYCPLPGERYSASSLLPAPLPDDLRDRMHFVSSDYYEMLGQCPLRHDQRGPQWFRQFFQIKSNVELRDRRYPNAASRELVHIATRCPESLLGVLEANWAQYVECVEWDEWFAATGVPILDSRQQKRLDSTYLPLPRLLTIVNRLGLEDNFGFLQELEGITELSQIKWSFLKYFGVAMEEDVEFWLALLTQARGKQDIECRVVFEIYQNLQRFSSSDDGVGIRLVYDLLQLKAS